MQVMNDGYVDNLYKNIMDGTKRGNINRIPPVELHSSSVELASTKQR